MRKYIRNILLFSIIFFLFDKAFYFFIALSPKLESDNRLERIIEGQMNKDIVILGSSRGARNVIADQLQDSLGKYSYNLSYPGSDIEFQEFILNTLIRFNAPPKKVILVVDDSRELLPSSILTFRYDRLYPLAKYKYINDVMIARGEKSISSKVLILSRMNIRNFNLRRKIFSELDSITTCGSMPISIQRENFIFNFDSTVRSYRCDLEIDYKINSFKNIQSVCIKNNIDLYLAFSPNFKIHNIGFENRMRDLSNESVKFIFYDSLNPVYKDELYYYDNIHLQRVGAISFTNDIIDFLQKEIDDNRSLKAKYGTPP